MGEIGAPMRSRSPRFPARALEDVVEYARRIYDGVHTSAVDSLTAYKLMGFSGKSGPSSSALGAVRQFGLIEGTGDKTRISDLALQILEPSSEQERSDGLATAARRPEVFSAIFHRFDGRIPAADEPVRAFLIREVGFSKSGADDCLASLRSTLGYVQEGRVQATDEPLDENGGPKGEQRTAATTARPSAGSAAYRLPLTKTCVAELRFEGEVSERAIAALIQHIELMKDVWAE